MCSPRELWLPRTSGPCVFLHTLVSFSTENLRILLIISHPHFLALIHPRYSRNTILQDVFSPFKTKNTAHSKQNFLLLTFCSPLFFYLPVPLFPPSVLTISYRIQIQIIHSLNSFPTIFFQGSTTCKFSISRQGTLAG